MKICNGKTKGLAISCCFCVKLISCCFSLKMGSRDQLHKEITCFVSTIGGDGSPQHPSVAAILARVFEILMLFLCHVKICNGKTKGLAIYCCFCVKLISCCFSLKMASRDLIEHVVNYTYVSPSGWGYSSKS